MDPISLLSGMADASAFVDGSTTASASKVVTEFGQLINKSNEIIGGLTVVASDLVSGVEAREILDASVEVRISDLEADILAREAIDVNFATRIFDAEAAIVLLQSATAVGYVEVANGSVMLGSTSAHMINFTGIGGMQSLELPSTMTGFEAGKNWMVMCNNADGVQITPSGSWAFAGLTTDPGSINLLVSDMAIIAVVDIGTTLGWSHAIIRGEGGRRAAPALSGDLGATDQDDKIIWVDRTADSGVRDLVLPDLSISTLGFNHYREIMVVLTGTMASGSFLVSTFSFSDKFADGTTSYTMPENTTCTFIGNGLLRRWARK